MQTRFKNIHNLDLLCMLSEVKPWNYFTLLMKQRHKESEVRAGTGSSLNAGGVQYQLTGPNRPLFSDSKKAFLKETKKRITVGL